MLKHTVGPRVSDKEEYEGLDIDEHGSQAYPEDHTSRPVVTPAPVVAPVAAPVPSFKPGTESAS